MVTEKTRLQLANLLVDNTSCIGDEADRVIPMILSLLEKEAAGIVSYLASPETIRNQYKLETGNEIPLYSPEKKPTIRYYVDKNTYIQWLEQQLIRLRAR